ncbi:OstA-like protein [Melioribacteraceae bacterium 4301-Me]|uniref:OstA-like protein n=1 Tax=Pyranulibacter aquaticus TaxID=3163344 RepID=UPI0035979F9D
MKVAQTIIIILFFSIITFAQEQENFIHVIGDSLRGRIVNGENIREVIGNVNITQGDVHIICDNAIQYLAKNKAELIGNVVLKQDSIIVETERGFYDGNSKTAYSLTRISLNDGHIKLTADSGYYFSEEKKSKFLGNVLLQDSISTLKAKKLIYFNEEDKAIATGNVIVTQQNSSLIADSLIHTRKNGVTLAFNNVALFDEKQKLLLIADELIDSSKVNHSILRGEPLLVQVDTSKSGKLDTLFISSKEMEAVKDSASDIMTAKDSVKIIRGEFASVNNYTFYNRKENFIFTYRTEQDINQPILWYEETQLSGDSINIYLKDNELEWMNINNNAFLLSLNKDYQDRYNQISGKNIKMYFKNNNLYLTDVVGNVLSIYYLFEDKEPNGLLKSSAERIKVFFDSTGVTDVKLYSSPSSEYHPEKMIKDKEKDFTLPTFIVYNNKPKKIDLLKSRKIPFYLFKKNSYE